MNPVMSALAQWCEAFVNGALSLDPVAEARMRRLDGRSFVIVSTAPEETFTIRCVGSRLLVSRSEPHSWDSGDAPNVILTGTASALVAALTGIGTPDVTIEGDEALLDELRSIVRELEPDLARPLSPLIGAEPAAALSGFVSAGAKAVRSMFAALDAEGTRWVRDTAHRRFAASAEVERFIERVTALRLAVDRLDARVRQLETRATPSRGSA